MTDEPISLAEARDRTFQLSSNDVMRVWDQIRKDCEGEQYRGHSLPRDVFENLVAEIEASYHERLREAADALAALGREKDEAVEWSRLRAVDLQRLGIAAGAAFAFVEKLAECQPHIDGMFTFAYVHDIKYTGPNYEGELLALKRALSEVGLSRNVRSDEGENPVK